MPNRTPTPDAPPVRLDPYTTPQLVAAGLVIAIPTALAFVLGYMLDNLGTGLIWAAVVGFITGSVIATSALITHVRLLPAVTGISGVWGACAGFTLWVLPHCPTWLGPICGSRQYGSVIAVGMLLPWFIVAFILPIPLGVRAVWTWFKSRRSENA